jgi:hypothetical protein
VRVLPQLCPHHVAACLTPCLTCGFWSLCSYERETDDTLQNLAQFSIFVALLQGLILKFDQAQRDSPTLKFVLSCCSIFPLVMAIPLLAIEEAPGGWPEIRQKIRGCSQRLANGSADGDGVQAGGGVSAEPPTKAPGASESEGALALPGEKKGTLEAPKRGSLRAARPIVTAHEMETNQL